MAYDSLFHKSDAYVKNKTQLDSEFEIFTKDALQVEDVIADSVNLDDEVKDSLLGIQKEFHDEQDSFDEKQSELEAEKNELADTINDELKKLNKADQKLDSLAGKKYTGELERASKRCKDYLAQLEGILEKLNATADVTSASSDSAGASASGSTADAGIFHRQSADHYTVSMQKYPKIVGAHSIEDDLRAVNPNYDFMDPDSPWCNNCQRCVSAYEARRRGYDVEAQMLPSESDTLLIMNHPQGWPHVYQNPDLIDCSANSGTQAMGNVLDRMAEWGDDARAIVRVRWKPEYGGGGHVFIAERVNGVTRFVDPQSGCEDASAHFDIASGNGLFCMRTDNLEFSDLIHRCCQLRNKD